MRKDNVSSRGRALVKLEGWTRTPHITLSLCFLLNPKGEDEDERSTK